MTGKQKSLLSFTSLRRISSGIMSTRVRPKGLTRLWGNPLYHMGTIDAGSGVLRVESEVSEKGRVAGILAGLYEAEGLKKEALFLLNVMKDHCLAEEKSQILEKLEALQE